MSLFVSGNTQTFTNSNELGPLPKGWKTSFSKTKEPGKRYYKKCITQWNRPINNTQKNRPANNLNKKNTYESLKSKIIARIKKGEEIPLAEIKILYNKSLGPFGQEVAGGPCTHGGMTNENTKSCEESIIQKFYNELKNEALGKKENIPIPKNTYESLKSKIIARIKKGEEIPLAEIKNLYYPIAPVGQCSIPGMTNESMKSCNERLVQDFYNKLKNEIVKDAAAGININIQYQQKKKLIYEESKLKEIEIVKKSALNQKEAFEKYKEAFSEIEFKKKIKEIDDNLELKLKEIDKKYEENLKKEQTSGGRKKTKKYSRKNKRQGGKTRRQ